MTKITQKNSPEYLTIQECQDICRFKVPDAIRKAVNRGDITGIRLTANKTLVLASSFWKWFHRNDVHILKPKSVEMPAGTIKKPKEKQTA